MQIEDGERLTGYFFKLKHERTARNSFTSILDSNDVEVFTREETEGAFLFRSFFSEEPIDAA